MKKVFLNIVLCCLANSFTINAQQQNVWTFGGFAGIDFNSGSPVAIMTAVNAFGEANACVCNNKGQLLFYTEGSIVWDRLGNIMPNGDTLITDEAIRSLAAKSMITPTTSATQGALIIPMPDSAGKYYIFSQTSVELSSSVGRSYWSIADMNLRGGLGDIEPGKRGILLDSNNSEKMTGVVGDHCDVWLLLYNTSGNLKAFEITDAGINTTPVISHIGFMSPVGVMKVSPNRKKLIFANDLGTTANLLDFDPATGKASNNISLDVPNSYGASFSPDNSKVYIATIGFFGGIDSLYQFDISSGVAATINASKIAVGESASDLKIAPDNKIYFAGADYIGSNTMSCITHPNLAGTACDIISDAVILDTNTYALLGLPNEVPVFKRDTAYNSLSVKVCFEDSTLLLADTSGWDYQWSDSSLHSYRTVSNSGNYWVSYTTAPCIHHTDTFKVLFASKIPSTGFNSGCKKAGNSAQWVLPVPGDTNTYKYVWTDAAKNILQTHTVKAGSDTLYGKDPGTYGITMIGNNGCDTTMYITLLPPDYQASFTSDTLTCTLDTLQFKNTSTGFSSYVWDFGDSTTSTLSDPTHVYNKAGRYKVQLVGLPCDDTAFIYIQVDSFGKISFTPDKKEACQGETINFYISKEGSYPNELLWNFGDGVQTPQWQPIQHSYDQTGHMTITVTARYRSCPSAIYSDTVNIYPYPQVNLGPDTSICPGDAALVLSNGLINPVSYTYLWSTGATTESIETTTPAAYWLMVTSDHGCIAADTEIVKPNCYVGIPNAFSPNGDGINDYFFPRELLSKGVIAFHMEIFDRWGVEIFATDNVNGRGWDGRFNGVQQPAGVYIYVITVSFKNDITQTYKGNITLISNK
ncbi:MAG TPA: gliding motility-associated C-terminal domain-containing protein [Flavipsychrobacter sp.]|nr:gliding motility-associated C-terminal domain-containing protein [Flavipsychrobacter sp.]